jgi:2,3-bisphosphoglycerate-independent phosphoglycerate mutase
VTFFLNALRDEPFDGEIRIGLDSPKCASYKEKPEMSDYEVCDEVCKLVSEESEGVVIVNFANCDLVGHSGDFEATAKACAVVDECVAKIVDAVMFSGGVGLITADHGNADEMYYENGDVKPGHSEGLVSCTMFGKGLEGVDAVDGTLIDVAPTFLGMIGVGVPECMTGKDLLVPGS